VEIATTGFSGSQFFTAVMRARGSRRALENGGVQFSWPCPDITGASGTPPLAPAVLAKGGEPGVAMARSSRSSPSPPPCQPRAGGSASAWRRISGVRSKARDRPETFASLVKGFTPMKSLPRSRDALRGEPCGEIGRVRTVRSCSGSVRSPPCPYPGSADRRL
jgi:hypothetical protein